LDEHGKEVLEKDFLWHRYRVNYKREATRLTILSCQPATNFATLQLVQAKIHKIHKKCYGDLSFNTL